MTSFNSREEAFEAKFVHDQECEFKVRARAMRMLGLWAAGKLGLSGVFAEDYAQELVEADIGATPSMVFARMVGDQANAGIDARQIREKRDALLVIARRSLDAGRTTPKV